MDLIIWDNDWVGFNLLSICIFKGVFVDNFYFRKCKRVNL